MRSSLATRRWFRGAILVTLSLTTSTTVLLLRLSRLEKDVLYLPSTVVFLTECVKVVLCLLGLAISLGELDIYSRGPLRQVRAVRWGWGKALHSYWFMTLFFCRSPLLRPFIAARRVPVVGRESAAMCPGRTLRPSKQLALRRAHAPRSSHVSGKSEHSLIRPATSSYRSRLWISRAPSPSTMTSAGRARRL